MAQSPFSTSQDIALIAERLRASNQRYAQDTIYDSGWYEPSGNLEPHTYYINGPPDDDRVDELLLTLGPDGAWPELDYREPQESGLSYWQISPHTHLTWALLLAQALASPSSRHQASPRVAQVLTRALDFWALAPRCREHIWWQEIGCPRWMARIIFLARPWLSSQTISTATTLIGAKLEQSGWGDAYKGMCQTQVWAADIILYLGCLTQTPDHLHKARRLIEEALTLSPGQGIQKDFSFQNPGNVLASGAGGYHLAVDATRIAWLLCGTQFELSEKTLDTCRLYLLEHQQWILRGQTYDPGLLGMEISRPGRDIARLIPEACANLMRVPQLMDDTELRAMHDRLMGPVGQSVSPLVGSRVFWNSDYLVHQRREFFVSLRMLSTRTVNAEQSRQLEGLTNHHMADGALFVMCHGREYDRVFPGWNWRRIPGTTAVQSDGPLDPERVSRRGESRFAGGATDGMNACAGMRLRNDQLSATKSWFFVDHTVLCLGSNISDQSGLSVATSLDQCRLLGDVIVAGKFRQTMAYRQCSLNNPDWIWHDHVGYALLEPARVGIHPGPHLGDWGICNGQRVGQIETPCLLDAWIDHGVFPNDANYSYAVLPGSSCDDMDRFKVTPGYQILCRTRSAHAVHFPRKSLVLAVGFEAGQVEVGPWAGTIGFNRPCALMVHHKADQLMIWVSSPEHATGPIQIDIDLANGPKVRQRIELTLPSGPDAGSTVGVGVAAG